MYSTFPNLHGYLFVKRLQDDHKKIACDVYDAFVALVMQSFCTSSRMDDAPCGKQHFLEIPTPDWARTWKKGRPAVATSFMQATDGRISGTQRVGVIMLPKTNILEGRTNPSQCVFEALFNESQPNLPLPSEYFGSPNKRFIERRSIESYVEKHNLLFRFQKSSLRMHKLATKTVLRRDLGECLFMSSYTRQL